MHTFRRLRFDALFLWPLRRVKWPPRSLVTFGMVLALTLGAILAVPLSRASLVAPNQPSPVTLQAPESTTYTSDLLTRQAQETAANEVQPVYRLTPNLIAQQREALSNALNSIGSIRADSSLGQEGQLEALDALAEPPIDAALARSLLNLNDQQWQRVVGDALTLYDTVFRERDGELTEEELAELRVQGLPMSPDLAGRSEDERQIVQYFGAWAIRANKIVDREATGRQRDEARQGVEPIEETVVRGENLVREGEIVTETEYEALTKLGLASGAGGWVTTAQMLLLGTLLATLFATYIHYCHETLARDDRALLVIVLLVGVALFAGRLLIPNWDPAPYAFPFATLAILLTVLFNGPLAVVAVLTLAPLLGLQHEERSALSLPLALGALAAVFTAQRTRRTGDFAFVGLSVAIFTSLTAFVFWLGPGTQAADVGRIVLFGLVNGALSSVLAIGSYHFLGRMAGVVTPLELMELSHPNRPLLRRLMREAPGTYHHSMVVGNLAEVAAENIGADPLLTRVGAYYHDVGKLLRPYFFTDNQHDRSNVHDALDARTSASIIIDHVREGAKLARDNGLPQRVVDFIPQHHGTNLVSFFYQRALKEDADADPDQFRYPGPKPQTREAAILMLADGVEAAVRAKAQAGKLRPARPEENGETGSGQSIADIVDQIVKERITSTQLDEAPLTLHDLSVIKESFVQTLQGIYHPRVEYPAQRARFDEDAVPK